MPVNSELKGDCSNSPCDINESCRGSEDGLGVGDNGGAKVGGSSVEVCLKLSRFSDSI